MDQMELIKRLEEKVEGLENKLYSMKLDMMDMEAKQTLYRLENLNMILQLQMMIKNNK